MIYETPGAAPHPIAAHTRIAPELARSVAACMVELGRDPRAATALGVIQMRNPIAADWQKDYEPLKKLDLGSFVELE